MARQRLGERTAIGRLTGGDDFQTVFRAGSRHITAIATLYVLPNQKNEVRLGIPVRRQLGGAVRRNRLRRRIREAFRRVRALMVSGADVIVVPRSAAHTVPFAALLEVLRGALLRAGLIADGVAHSPAVDAQGLTA